MDRKERERKQKKSEIKERKSQRKISHVILHLSPFCNLQFSLLCDITFFPYCNSFLITILPFRPSFYLFFVIFSSFRSFFSFFSKLIFDSPFRNFFLLFLALIAKRKHLLSLSHKLFLPFFFLSASFSFCLVSIIFFLC